MIWILILLLLMPALAQNDSIAEFRPVLFTPRETQEASVILFVAVQDLFGDEAAKRAAYRAWLDNVTNLTNVSEVA